jgi:hypothetical protein
MLNKDLLMAVGEGLELVLSICFTPGNQAQATVYVRLSSGNEIMVTDQEIERKTFKFSEIDVTAEISIRYNQYLTHITTKNLVDSPIQTRVPEVTFMSLWIEDVTQSASIVIE